MGYGTSQPNHAHCCCLLLVICICSCTTVTGVYVWNVGKWQRECINNVCGRGGIQNRFAWCGEKGSITSVADEYCLKDLKPAITRSCFKVCDEHRNKLRWVSYPWSECKLNSSNEICSRKGGLQHRDVVCVWKETGLPENEMACSFFESKPVTEQVCELKCPQDCVVSKFTPWSKCDNCIRVNSTRLRSILVPPANGGAECPLFSEMSPCLNCSDSYTYKIDPFGTCIPFGDQNIKKIHPLIGYQRRTIECLHSYGPSVNLRYCTDSIRILDTNILTTIQTCIIPQDCIVSQWSVWKPINSSCIDHLSNKRPGYMTKTRSVLQIPMGTGKPCPELVNQIEVQGTAHTPCPRARWITSNWGECEASSGSYQCQAGLLTRSAICVEGEDDGHLKPVPESKCPTERPLTSQVCSAQCKIDCTVSQWTAWSECKVTDCELYVRRRRTNEGTGQRYRTREVLTPQEVTGEPCPHLSETQTCDPQPCYQWNVTVGSCALLIPNNPRQCGLGQAFRTIACINKINHRVADSLCQELVERPIGKEDCNIPCPNDCVLSQWSLWTECPNLCQEGNNQSASRTRYRTILARSSQDGAPCPPNRLLQEKEQCPTSIQCAVYVWQTDPWEELCELTDKKKRCGNGVMKRHVNCYNKQGHVANDQRCTLDVKPAETKNCTVPCPVNCKHTEYSDWSPCTTSCWEAKQVVPVQTRQRFIIQQAQYGGIPCPDKLTEAQQCTDLPLCYGYYWDTEEWSDCILPPRVPNCGKGLQARNVTCKSENGTSVSFNLCIHHNGLIPLISKPCYKSCDDVCLFTEWSQWSLCVHGCTGTRFRTRTLIVDPKKSVPSRCRNPMLYPKDEFERCLCDVPHPVPVGNWSECILEMSDDPSYFKGIRSFQGYTARTGYQAPYEGIHAICGSGKQYKVLACQNDVGEIEPSSRCSHMSYEEEVCIIPCPVDCVMSDWSRWSDCSTSCGTGAQIRFRHIKQIPSDSGRPCPKLDDVSMKETQSRICRSDCTKFVWNTYEWSMCMPSSRTICGEGTRTRTVRCEAISTDGQMMDKFDSSKCQAHQRPVEKQPCYAACVSDCVLSDWAEWSLCKELCDDNMHYQVRKRQVMRRPFPFHQCNGSLEESRLCVKGDNCIEYRWEFSEWMSCLINNGLDECGVGHMQRYAVCKNHFNEEVDHNMCEKFIGPFHEPLVATCQVPCDTDCLLTHWTSWTECSHTCGLGTSSRTRAIVQEPQGNGRACPTSLKQNKPCLNQGCYFWVVSPWSECTSEVGVCGYGVQTRNVTCVASSGLPVNSSRCPPDLNVAVTQTQMSCQVPCPGECVISQWSEWSDCHVNCIDFNQGYNMGIQSRSRAILLYPIASSTPCPDQLWESKPCTASRCYTFDWKVTPWNIENSRSVACMRSDGLEVTGGCINPKPRILLSCDPPCRAPHSYCNDTNHCTCYHPLLPVYTNHGTLTACLDKASNQTTAVLVSTPKNKHVECLAGDKRCSPVLSSWIYAVVAAATVVIIVLSFVLYRASEYFHKGPRPRGREEQGSLRSMNDGDDVAVLATNNVQSFHSERSMNCNHSSMSNVTTMKACNDETDSIISVDHTPSDIVGAHTAASCLHANMSSELVSDSHCMHNILPACSMLSSSDIPLYSSVQSKYLSLLKDSSQRKHLDQGNLKRRIPQILVTDCTQNTYYSDSEVMYSLPHPCMNSVNDSKHKENSESRSPKTKHFKAEDLKIQTNTEEKEIHSKDEYELDIIPLRIMDNNSLLDDVMEKISHIEEETSIDESAAETSFQFKDNDKIMMTIPMKVDFVECHDSFDSGISSCITGSAPEMKLNDCHPSYVQVRNSASSNAISNSGLPISKVSVFHHENMDDHLSYLEHDTMIQPTISPETDHVLYPPKTNRVMLDGFSPAELFQENSLKYNSIDTEPGTSSVPMTSVSCESLQSSDENDLTSDVSLGEIKWDRKSPKEIRVPPRNIAINSLTRRKHKESFLKHSSSKLKDSGISITSNETTPNEAKLSNPRILSRKKTKGHVLVGGFINKRDYGKQSEPGGFELYEMDSMGVTLNKQGVISETCEETPLMVNGTSRKLHSKTDRRLAVNSLTSQKLNALSSAETKRLLFASKS